MKAVLYCLCRSVGSRWDESHHRCPAPSIPGSMLWSSSPKPRPGARPWPSAPAAAGSIWSLGCGSRICPCLKIHPWIKGTGCFWAIAWGRVGSRHLPALPGGSRIRAGNGNVPTRPSPALAGFPVAPAVPSFVPTPSPGACFAPALPAAPGSRAWRDARSRALLCAEAGSQAVPGDPQNPLH